MDVFCLQWREKNGVVSGIVGEDEKELAEIGKAIYEAYDDIDYVCVCECGKPIVEFKW